jgi:GNAT superfamily N-acetyltransferase
MQETFEIRKAASNDIPALVRICAESFPDSLRWNGPEYQVRRWWTEAIRTPSCETWVAVNVQHVSGFAILVLDNKSWTAAERRRNGGTFAAMIRIIYRPDIVVRRIARRAFPNNVIASLWTVRLSSGSLVNKTWVELVAVERTARGLGIARKLLSQLENRTRETGHSAIGLSVENHNRSAGRLYQGLGYRINAAGRWRSTWEKVLPRFPNNGQPEPQTGRQSGRS